MTQSAPRSQTSPEIHVMSLFAVINGRDALRQLCSFAVLL